MPDVPIRDYVDSRFEEQRLYFAARLEGGITREDFERFRETWRIEHAAIARQLDEARGRAQANARLIAALSAASAVLSGVATALALVLK